MGTVAHQTGQVVSETVAHQTGEMVSETVATYADGH